MTALGPEFHAIKSVNASDVETMLMAMNLWNWKKNRLQDASAKKANALKITVNAIMQERSAQLNAFVKSVRIWNRKKNR